MKRENENENKRRLRFAACSLRRKFQISVGTLLCGGWAWKTWFEIRLHTCLWLFRDWFSGRHAACVSGTKRTLLLRCTLKRRRTFGKSLWKRSSAVTYYTTCLTVCVSRDISLHRMLLSWLRSFFLSFPILGWSSTFPIYDTNIVAYFMSGYSLHCPSIEKNEKTVIWKEKMKMVVIHFTVFR